MVNYFVCSCLFDFALFSNYNGINEFIESMEKMDCSKSNILILEYGDSFYISCKETVQFLYHCYPELYKSCIDECLNEYSDPELVNCLDLFLYGYEDICENCESVIFSYLLRILR